MIGSITIGLEAKDYIKLKGLGGEALHGLFFKALRAESVGLAHKLHDLDDQKPFSLSFLNGYELSQGYCHIPCDGTPSFRLALLNEEIICVVISTFFNIMAEGRILYLSKKPVIVKSIDMHDGMPSSFTSFCRLLESASPEEVIVLDFTTPTCFKSKGVQIPLPEPRLVFSSLLNKWNANSDIKFPEEYEQDFSLIKISNYNLRTELVNFSKYKIIGFKGRVEYELPEDASEGFLREVNALADFASYSGVGAKTTMGMGQVQRVN